MKEPDLFTLTRTTDPGTSHEAAEGVHKRISRLQQIVLNWSRKQAAFTDDDMVAELSEHHPKHSPSTWRTRRSELRDAGLIESIGRTRNERGNRVTVWRAIS